MHNAPVPINNHTPHQAFLGRQPHALPVLEGGCHGGLDAKGRNNRARVREIAAVAITEVIATQRLARADKRNQVVAMERSEHKPGDLVDIRYDHPNKDIPGWRGPAQIDTVNDGEGNIIARPQGRILEELESTVSRFIAVGVVLQQPG